MKLLTKIFAIVLIGSTVVACTDSKKESKAETAMEEIKDSFKSEQSDLKLADRPYKSLQDNICTIL